MANISALYTSLSGMQAQRKVMDITAHNVSNASTEGYHRQRVELRSTGTRMGVGIDAGRSQMYGVDVLGVSRSVDDLLEARSMREEAGRAAATLTNATMERTEGIFGEPSSNGISSQLQAFWGAWTDVANNPGGLAGRTALLRASDTLAGSLQRTAADLQSVKDTAMAGMVDLASDANGLAAQIADINKKIVGAPDAANDLMDRRSLLINQLGQLTGAVGRPGDNGQVDVYVGGRAIVAGQLSFQIDGTGGALRWTSDGGAVTASSGQAATLTATITDIVPRYVAQLDAVASSLVSTVNSVHSAGYDQSGTTGRDFFDPANVTAATISLSADVAGQPGNIAAGAPSGGGAPGPLDGEQARAIATLAASTSGADSTYKALIADLAVESRAATRRADIQDQIADSVRAQVDSVGAVSIDEEMANLTASQRAFEASARVLTVVDEMLNTLIHSTGVVGR